MEPSSLPEEVSALRGQLVELLDQAQRSAVHHPRLLESLRALHATADVVTFFEAFMGPLSAALVVDKREPAAERVMEFVAKFTASLAPLAPSSPSPSPDDQEEEDTLLGR